MHAGIKIYKLDNHNNSVNNEMLAFIASLEISDVYHTLNRYKSAYRSLEETREMRYCCSCLYEASSRRIPPWIHVDHVIGGSQIQPQTAGLETDEEKSRRAGLEGFDLTLALGRGG